MVSVEFQISQIPLEGYAKSYLIIDQWAGKQGLHSVAYITNHDIYRQIPDNRTVKPDTIKVLPPYKYINITDPAINTLLYEAYGVDTLMKICFIIKNKKHDVQEMLFENSDAITIQVIHKDRGLYEITLDVDEEYFKKSPFYNLMKNLVK